MSHLSQNKYLLNLYRLASILGIVPFYNFGKGILSSQKLTNIYGIILLLLQTAVIYPVLDLIDYKWENKLIAFLIKCTIFTSCCFASTMTCNNFTKQLEWAKLLRLLKYSTNQSYLQSGRRQKQATTTVFRMMLYSVSFLEIGYTIYDIFMAYEEDAYFITILTSYLRFTTIIFAILATEFIEIIHNQFQELNEHIKICIQSTTIMQISTKKIFLTNISKIRRKYRNLSETVESFNTIFGMSILIFTFNVLIHILNIMNIFIFSWKNSNVNVDLTIKSLVPTIGCCVSIKYFINKINLIVCQKSTVKEKTLLLFFLVCEYRNNVFVFKK